MPQNPFSVLRERSRANLSNPNLSRNERLANYIGWVQSARNLSGTSWGGQIGATNWTRIASTSFVTTDLFLRNRPALFNGGPNRRSVYSDIRIDRAPDGTVFVGSPGAINSNGQNEAGLGGLRPLLPEQGMSARLADVRAFWNANFDAVYGQLQNNTIEFIGYSIGSNEAAYSAAYFKYLVQQRGLSPVTIRATYYAPFIWHGLDDVINQFGSINDARGTVYARANDHVTNYDWTSPTTLSNGPVNQLPIIVEAGQPSNIRGHDLAPIIDDIMSGRTAGGGFVVRHANGQREYITQQQYQARILAGEIFYVPRPVDDPTCFAAGARILMANGSEKTIETVEVGDQVLAFDRLGQLEPRTVLQTHRNTSDTFYELVGAYVTPGHHVLCEDGEFRAMSEVVALGHSLVRADGTIFSYNGQLHDALVGIAPPPGQDVGDTWQTYNLSVEGWPTYVANGVRVHNTSVRNLFPVGAVLIADYVTTDGKSQYAVAQLADGSIQEIIGIDADGIAGTDMLMTVIKTPDGRRITGRLKRGDYSGVQIDVATAYNWTVVHPVAMGEIMATLGSSLGNFLGNGDPLARIAASSLLATVGRNIGQALDLGRLQDVSQGFLENIQTVSANFGAELGQALGGAAIGTISSILALELGNLLGVEGFGGELFQTAASSVIGQVLQNATQVVAGAQGASLFAGFGTQDLFGNVLSPDFVDPTQWQPGMLSSAIGAFIGARLGSMVVAPTTQAGVVLSSLGSALGAFAFGVGAGYSGAIGTFAAGLAAKLGSMGNLIVPGIGAFIGFVLGAFIGNLFGRKKPKVPTANAATYLDFNTDEYELGASSAANGGNLDLVRSMASSARQTLNGFLYVMKGDMPSDTAPATGWRGYGQAYAFSLAPTLTFGHTGGQLWFSTNYSGQTNVTSADIGVERAVLSALTKTFVVGGDLLVKRAVSRFVGTDVTTLLGNIQIAQDYGRYLEQRVAINGMIAANPESAFSAAYLTVLSRVDELGLNEWSASDFYGGLQGFLMSFNLEGHGAYLEDVSLSQIGSHLRIGLPVAVDEGVFTMMGTASSDGRSVDVTDFFNGGYFRGNSVGYVVSPDGQISQNQYVSGATTNDFIDHSASTTGVTIADFTTWEEAQYWWTSPGGMMQALEEPIYVTHTVTGGNDIFLGGSGDDILEGYAGWDWLSGGAGNDTLSGMDDNDVLLGGDGSDSLYGGYGADYLAGGVGSDTLSGDAGDDVLVGGAGADTVYGGDGNDVLVVDQNDGAYDSLDGGSGLDGLSFERWTAGVTFALGSGGVFGDGYVSIEDVIGTRHADAITGDAQANRLFGGAGDDTLSGGDGDDVLDGGFGADVLAGGSGTDTASYTSSRAGVFVDLTTGEAFSGDASEDAFSSIENLRGSRFSDELKGDAGANRLEGGDSDDLLVATTGNDVFDGGDGVDMVDYSEATAGVTANIGGASSAGLVTGYGSGGLATGHTYISVETILGSAFGDYLSGGLGAQEFMGGKGADYLAGGAGADTYHFELGDGVDSITDDNVDANAVSFGSDVGFNSLSFSYAGGAGGFLDVYYSASDYVRMNGNFAVAANNRLKVIDMNGAGQLDVSGIHHFTGGGTTGSDTIYGYAGYSDLITGHGGNDVIYGSSGSWENKGNVIIGGAGDDTIVTSAGDDQFAFERGSGRDTVTDAGGEDTIVFGPNVAADDVIYKVVGNDLYIGIAEDANPAYEAHQVTDYVRVVNGAIRYQNVSTGAQSYAGVEFVNAGGSWIDLRKLSIDWVTSYTSGWPPIVLDLDGDGLDLVGVNDSLIVSRLSSGYLARTSWVGPTDGFLAVDRDGDGQINRSSEISFLGDREGATTDLEGLQAWDTNGDGMISNLDDGWSRLKLWVDTNQNGRSTSGELRTLDEIGIIAINLTGTPTGSNFANAGGDSFVHNTLSFTWASGATGQGYDVELARELVNGEGLSLEELRAAWGEGIEDSELGRMITEYRLLNNGARTRRPLLGRTGDTQLTEPFDPDLPSVEGDQGFDIETVAEERPDFSDHDNLFAEDLVRQAQRRRLTPQGVVETDPAVRAALERLTNGIERPGRFDRPFAPGDGSEFLTSSDGMDALEPFGRSFGAARARPQNPEGDPSNLRRSRAANVDLNSAVERLRFADAVGTDPWAAAPVTLATGPGPRRWWNGMLDGYRPRLGPEQLTATDSLGPDEGIDEFRIVCPVPGGEEGASQHQKLMQAMASFGPRSGAGAAVWRRSGELDSTEPMSADTGSSRWRFTPPARISA